MFSRLAVIYEGERTEASLFNNIEEKIFKDKSNITLIHFPAAENIHMLFQRIAQELQATPYLDIIEMMREHSKTAAEKLQGLCRDNFEGIYLFFDFDPQDSNYNEENLKLLFEIFDNETVNGKLYISYPMIEAIRDLKFNDSCRRRCSYQLSSEMTYKKTVSDMTEFTDFGLYDFDKWKLIFQHAVRKANCIVFETDLANCGASYILPEREIFIEKVTQSAIYRAQLNKFVANKEVAVLSSVPLFLLEYKCRKFWKGFLAG